MAQTPPVLPQRDVDVRYDVAGRNPGGSPQQERIRWSVATGKMRVDPPTAGLYIISDYRSGRTQVVKPDEQSVLELDRGQFMVHAGAAMTRLDADQVAGLACTNWQTPDNRGQPAVLCLTADGVMLRASSGDQVLVEARSVTYAPQDPAAFLPPDGFRRIAPATIGSPPGTPPGTPTGDKAP